MKFLVQFGRAMCTAGWLSTEIAARRFWRPRANGRLGSSRCRKGEQPMRKLTLTIAAILACAGTARAGAGRRAAAGTEPAIPSTASTTASCVSTTRTGQVAFCSPHTVGWACQAVPEDRAALEKEIARLQDEVASLKKAGREFARTAAAAAAGGSLDAAVRKIDNASAITPRTRTRPRRRSKMPGAGWSK